MRRIPLASEAVDLENEKGRRRWPSRSAIVRSAVRGTLLALPFLAILAVPSAAMANGLLNAFDNVTQFTLHASNGYRITVSDPIFGPRQTRTVKLEAVDQNLLAQRSRRVEYTAPGKVTPNGLEASFGRLGAISVRFRASGKVERIKWPKKCGGGQVEAKLGSFVGTIRFTGERGYTEVDAHRATGGIGNLLALSAPHNARARTIYLCGSSERSGKPEEEPQEPFLYVQSKGRTIGFLAISTPSLSPQQPPESLFNANVSEKRGRISISRSISANGPASDFIFNSAFSAATVAPPAPFVGSASFQRNADGSTSWTGSLSVPLPGRGMVRLAGPNFKGELSK